MNHRTKLLRSIKKEAFDASTITTLFTDAFNQVIDKEHPVLSVIQLLAEGLLINRFGWIAMLGVVILDKAFGINIKNLFKIISTHFSSFVKQNQGQKIDIEQAANSISDSVISELNVPPDKANKPFGDVAEEKGITASKEYQLVKNASWLNIVGSVTLRSFVFAIIKAAFKAVFAATAVGAGVGAIKKDVSVDTALKAEEKPKDVVKQTFKDKAGQPSSQGQTYHTNNANKETNNADKEETKGEAWYSPLIETSLDDYLKDWIYSIYPNMPDNLVNIIEQETTVDELTGKKITNFNKAFAPIKQEFQRWNPSLPMDNPDDYVRIPAKIGNKEIHTFKDIIDLILSSFVIQ